MPAKSQKIDASEWTQHDWTELYEAIDRVKKNVKARHSGVTAQSPGSGEALREAVLVLINAVENREAFTEEDYDPALEHNYNALTKMLIQALRTAKAALAQPATPPPITPESIAAIRADLQKQIAIDCGKATLPLPSGEKLRIVAAACQHKGITFTGAHHHLIMWQIACCTGERQNGEQGFVANDGRFYDREQSYIIASTAKQIRFPLPHVHDELFSEELWSYADWLKEHKMGDSPDAHPPSVKIGDGKDGVSLIAAERARQVSVEGWTPAHDDEHSDRAMVEAAICYAQAAQFIGAGVMRAIRDTPDCWPWDHEWWKPSENPIRNLVKAGALIGAEIDRLIRAQADAGREEK